MACVGLCPGEWAATAYSRFRSEIRVVYRLSKVMGKYNPMMFCLNDSENTTDEDCARIVDFMETLFPDKSAFEK